MFANRVRHLLPFVVHQQTTSRNPGDLQAEAVQKLYIAMDTAVVQWWEKNQPKYVGVDHIAVEVEAGQIFVELHGPADSPNQS